jgi:MFS family permease
MLWATRYPPIRRAGANLLLSVAGFGVAMIVFGLSRNFYLSLVALAFSGGFDGVSMVIRGAILRMLTPEHLRGRVAAVNWVFIGSSNELGAMESGVFAKMMGTARSVWAGGIVTLLVVAATTGLAPKLRNLGLDPASLDQEEERGL